jgi:large subunit ribosomal protein L21
MTTDYAIINTGGKQYRVREGDTVDIERVPGEVGTDITFDRVLMTSVGGKLSVGAPAVKGATVTGEISAHSKADKVISLRYKNKTRQHVKRGHRQLVTSVTIKKISAK